jgi:hypothetical protein
MKMVSKKTTIPWESEGAWAQVELSISKTISALSPQGAEIANVKTLAQKIVQGYAELETVLERVCLTSCPTCLDVCCSRATVWYDLKDLLLVYLNCGTLPDRQIFKLPDHSCCHLTPSGCRLQRSDRPFICTWYICPAQKNIIEGFPNSEGRHLFRTIDKLKTARKELEEEYVKASCG